MIQKKWIQHRMFVFSNLAISLDGKIATASREHFPLGTIADRRQMQVLRRRCDAILMGASTLRAYRSPCLAKGTKRQPINIILSSNLSGISPSWDFFRETNLRRILLVTNPKKISKKRIAAFKKTSEIIPIVHGAKIANQVIRELSDRGVRRLLVEGGGGVMWDFVRSNLIDEYHVTLTPLLIGGVHAPTLVDGVGFSRKEVLNLNLKSCRRIGDELFLVYQRKSN